MTRLPKEQRGARKRILTKFPADELSALTANQVALVEDFVVRVEPRKIVMASAQLGELGIFAILDKPAARPAMPCERRGVGIRDFAQGWHLSVERRELDDDPDHDEIWVFVGGDDWNVFGAGFRVRFARWAAAWRG